MIPNKKPLILIVDDTPENLQVLGNILYEKGYNLAIATSGTQALKSVSTSLPDLILLDIQMPDMDGFEVCKILKLNPQTKEIPIIFLTASCEQDKVLHGFELGAVDYILKPFNISELTARVATHIELKLSKEKLIELNATKDKFFSIIAHDLKNPFAGLLLSCKLLKRHIINKDLKKIEEIAELMDETSKDAFKLLENLLGWSKLQLGKFEAKKEIFILNIAVIEAIGGLKNVAAEKDIEITILDNYKRSALFDIEMFKSIIRNLTTNAIKFSEIGGKIIIGIKETGKKIMVSVIDNGTGIGEKDMLKLFKIDSSFSTPGTNKEQGSGLGLILCKEFAEKNGSQIFVKSEKGKGSTFSFSAEKA